MKGMDFQILTTALLDDFEREVEASPLEALEAIQQFEIPADYFQFYSSVSSVYSSKIEGEEIDFDSYFKHKFLHVQFKPDYTRRADDLFAAYGFIRDRKLTFDNVCQAHSILSASLLPKSQRGTLRNNPMVVINSEDRIEYVAAPPERVSVELDKLFHDLDLLQEMNLSLKEIFYFASLVHLVFVKIHPFQDGNGRTARLIEKWFLQQKIGEKATAIPLEKNYYLQRSNYYSHIRKIGLEYEKLDCRQSLDFLLMTIQNLNNQAENT